MREYFLGRNELAIVGLGNAVRELAKEPLPAKAAQLVSFLEEEQRFRDNL